MKNKIFGICFIAAVCFCFLGIVFLNQTKEMNNLSEFEKYKAEFNKSQKEYISSHKSINVYVDDNLTYLTEENGNGFLKAYIDRLMSPSGITIKTVTDKKTADCAVLPVTNKLRSNAENISYTPPILQEYGKLYIKDGYKNDGTATGVAVADRMNISELDCITYNNTKVKWKLVETNRKALEYARKHNTDFIVGDRSSMTYELQAEKDYIGLKDDLYDTNICIITDAGNETLAEIIKQCVHSMNRKNISYTMSEIWMNGNAPVYLEKDYSDIYALILIIFLAVLIAFFIYYQSNKNLYRELSDRMNKLKESKQELKTTFGSVGYCMAELDLQGGIMDINRAFYDFTRADTANRKLWEVMDFTEKDEAYIKDTILNIKQYGSLSELEVKISNRTMQIDIYPIDNAAGKVEKLLFIAKDVTNERMAERQMLQDNKMIAVGQLAAGVAHEIRNPLGIIRNYCYVLKNMDGEELKASAVENIEKAVDTSGKIIESLLNFSRVSSKVCTDIDVEEHINSLILLNSGILKKKNIQFVMSCPEPVKAFIVTESLDMILINLISNAIDAMENNGSLSIDIQLKRDEFIICVSDTGCGINKEYIDEIFNPFFTTKGSCGGTGLGLYIVYNEVSKLNGKIEVDSVPDEGTVFRVTLPLQSQGTSEGEAND